MQKIKELFPEVEKIQPPPKERKSRRKSKCVFSKTENYRRYRLHRKVKDLQIVKLEVRKKTIKIPLSLNVEFYPSIQELLLKFKYEAPT